jgi:hypothetical protein
MYSGANVIDVRIGNGSSQYASLQRLPVYWDQLQTPPSGPEENAAKVKVTNLVDALPQNRIINLVSDLAAKAPLNSPAFTGNPTAPTQPVGNNSTRLATTEFVQAAKVKPNWNAAPGSEAEILNKPNLDLKANLNSPAFTGNPTAPTQPVGDNSTKLATTGFVQASRVKPNWNAAPGSEAEILNKPGNATTSVAGLMSAADKTKLDQVSLIHQVVDWMAPPGSPNEILNKPTTVSGYGITDIRNFPPLTIDGGVP